MTPTHRDAGLLRSGTLLIVLLALAGPGGTDDWSRFRGPGGSGVLETSDLPVELGSTRAVRWKAALPPGHSSPVLAGNRIFVTGFEEESLLTLCVSADTGEVLWRRQIDRPREQGHHDSNNPASPTPVTDGRAVYVFFPDFGLVAYSVDGDELWRRPLGPFRNVHGIANSPVLEGDLLIQLCDQDAGSFLIVCDKRTGRTVRTVERFGPSYSTPVVYQRGETCEIVVSGTGELVGYDCRSGDRLWWVTGLPYQPKASPVVARLGAEDLVIFQAQSIGNFEELLPAWPQALEKYDKDGDGRLGPAEAGGGQGDSDGDGFVSEGEYAELRGIARAPHTLLAVRPGQRGDVSTTVLWRSERGIPEVPTPIVYQDALYLLRNGGIFSSLDPRTGEVLKRGRLEGALGTYYASPVASGGRLYLASQDGHIVVVKAGPDWEVESVGDLGEPVFATPAIAEGRLYVRTPSAMYCFAREGSRRATTDEPQLDTGP